MAVRKPEAVRVHESWFPDLWDQADERAVEEVLRVYEGRFRDLWNRADVQIVDKKSPLTSPGKSRRTAGEGAFS